MTLLACASSTGGTTRSGAFAVLRLNAGSMVVGCPTGKSAAWRPGKRRPAAGIAGTAAPAGCENGQARRHDLNAEFESGYSLVASRGPSPREAFLACGHRLRARLTVAQSGQKSDPGFSQKLLYVG
jgi:hypothetical protein